MLSRRALKAKKAERKARKAPAAVHDRQKKKCLQLAVFVAVLAIGCCFLLSRFGLVKPLTSDTLSTPSGPTTTEASLVRIATRSAVATTPDPEIDGWMTEAFSEQAEVQLKQLLKWLAHLEKVSQQQVVDVIAEDFICSQLRPDVLSTVFDDKSVVVRRSQNSLGSLAPDHHRGVSGLIDALGALAQPLSGRDHLTTSMKIVQVSEDDDSVATTCYYEASSPLTDGTFQQTATWRCRWSREEEGPPKLTSVILLDYEEVFVRSPHQTWFTDCTEAVLGKNWSFQEFLQYGANHWLRRIDTTHETGVFRWYGIAVGDVNNDGLDDIYICQPGGLPNRLFVQDQDATVSDHTDRAEIDILDHSSSALLVDLDNDGDQDLVVAIPSNLVLFENDSTGRFKYRIMMSPVLHLEDIDVRSVSAVDYDNDGRLDLYICMGSAFKHARPDEEANPFVYHDANDGGANVLFRNEIGNSGWRFVDVTKDVGLDVNNRRHSLAAAWEDYDNDGDQDLYVANDYGQNCLYRNDDGRFIDVAVEVGVVDYGSGMSVSWADYNRDGYMDLYVGNMFSSAGSRITNQAGFNPNANENVRQLYRRFVKGNTLFRNLSGKQFEDVGAQAAVEMGRWAWSSLFTDLNNDGWEDVVVANGYLTTEDTGDL